MIETDMKNFITLTIYVFKIIYNIYILCGRPGFNPWVRKIPWKRKCQPSPVFLPGEFHGQRSLAGYSPWGLKELDMTEWLHFLSFIIYTYNNCYYIYIYINIWLLSSRQEVSSLFIFLQRRMHLNKKLISKWEIYIKHTLKIPNIWKLNVHLKMMAVSKKP